MVDENSAGAFQNCNMSLKATDQPILKPNATVMNFLLVESYV